MVTETLGTFKPVPRLQGYPLIGVLPKVFGNPLQFLTNAMLEHKDMVILDLGFSSVYLVNHPDYIEHILKDNYRNYEKGHMWQPIKYLIGDGLPVAEGDVWLKQRRLMQPNFHRQKLSGLAEIINGTILASLEKWPALAQSGQPVDVLEEMLHLGLDIIVKTMFTANITQQESDLLCEKFTLIAKLVMYRMWTFFLPEWMPRPGDRRFHEAVQIADNILYKIIERRRETNEDTGDLLSMLMFARDEAGGGMTNKQLRDELMTVMTAGHETAAIALGWTWYLLSQNPDVEAKLHNELAEVLGGRMPTFDDLGSLVYTKMVIEESMRLYPPVWPIPRVAVNDDVVGQYRIPAGSVVVISPFVVHRHPDFWSTPEQFNPERFSPDEASAREKYAYIPFGGGPRICIGNNFAMMQAQLTLAIIAQKYSLKLVPDHKVEPHSSSTTKPKYGLPMLIRAR
jgi:cytochrome P450